ncbi:MAG: NADH-quinone oxidoreductase subunit C [Acidimicrobiia bacterium]|nr:MAG: NADH-quinone oxidoreductase subunit C [Acidimicrobiia bacterium]
MSERIDALVAGFPGASVEDSLGQAVVRLPRESMAAFAESARGAGFDTWIDLCGVDHLTRSPRFEVVVHLLSLEPPELLRILVGVPAEDPVVPTLTGVFAGANFFEREAFDLFGIEFEGHPDLTRILLPDEWVGHPLRKDAAVGSVPVQFKEANRAT